MSERSGIGFHTSPSYQTPFDPIFEYDQLLEWARELHDVYGVTDFKALGDGSQQSVRFCQALVQAGIEVTVRLYAHKPHPYYRVDPAVVALYVAVGVKLFEWGNEPNLALEWAGMPNDGVVVGHHFVVALCQQMIANTDAIVQGGGVALIPAMSPGTEGDTSGEFVCYQTLLNWYKVAVLDDGRRAWDWLWAHYEAGDLAGAEHNRFGNHFIVRMDRSVDLDYPNDPVNLHGEPLSPEEAAFHGVDEWTRQRINEWRESDKNPDATLLTDSTCFRSHELVDDIFIAEGLHLDWYATEAGPEIGDHWDRRYLPVTAATHALVAMEIIRRMNPKHPKAWRRSLKANHMWVGWLWGHGEFLASPWFDNPIHGGPYEGRNLPAVNALKQFVATENFVRVWDDETNPPEEEDVTATEFGIPETLENLFQEWVKGQGVYNAFMRHAMAVGAYEPTVEDLKLLAREGVSTTSQMVLSLDRFPFPKA